MRTAPLRHLLAPAAVLLLGFLAYSDSFYGAFVFDDRWSIVENPLLRDLASYLGSTAGYRASPNRYVAYLSFALNYRLGGLAVPGYHLVNLAIHLGSALLVYALARLAFRAPRLSASALASSRAVAFAAAALFATHPVQTQAVSYLVQRITSLAAFFYLATLVLYLAWRLGLESGRAGRWTSRATYGLALACALLATRTKEIAFTLPAAVLLLEAGLFGRPGARRLAALVPLVAVALIIPASMLSLGKPVGEVLSDVGQVTRVQATVGRLDYLRTEVAVVASYLRLLVWPTGQNVDHDVAIAGSFLEGRVLAGLALHAALLGLAAWLWRRTAPGAVHPLDGAARLSAVGIAFFFLALSVESSVIPIVDPMFEHRVYLPSAGIFLAVAAAAGLGLRRLWPDGWERTLATAATVAALALGVATFARNRVWWTDVRLWTDAAEKSPGKARPQFNLGTSLAEAGRTREAVAPLRRAVELDPGWAKARTQLGGLLILGGRPAEAEEELRAALRLAPDVPEAIFNLAEVLWRSGRRDEAAGWYRRFLEVAPEASHAALRRVAAARSGR